MPHQMFLSKSFDRSIGELTEEMAITKVGSGDLEVTGPVGKKFTLHNQGSGDILFKESLDQDARITSSGSGDLTFSKSVGENFTFEHQGSGNVIFQGLLSKNANLSFSGTGQLVLGEIDGPSTIMLKGNVSLKLTKALDDNVQLEGSLSSPVTFSYQPDVKILATIKRLQTKALQEALDSNDGYAQINNLKYKTGPGWIIIKENVKASFYRCNTFSIINGIKHLDGQPIDHAEKPHKQDNKATRFFKKLAGFFVTVNYTTLSITCRKPADPRSYYLAELPTEAKSTYTSLNDSLGKSNIVEESNIATTKVTKRLKTLRHKKPSLKKEEQEQPHSCLATKSLA